MINKNVLRIGNWVENLKDFKDLHVKYKNSPPIYYKIKSLHEIGANVSVFKKSLVADSDYSTLTGIPLTPEILVKSGIKVQLVFADGISEYNVIDNGKFETIVVSGNIIRLQGVPSKPIEYLHQLQNLYFALTGEELEVNELIT